MHHDLPLSHEHEAPQCRWQSLGLVQPVEHDQIGVLVDKAGGIGDNSLSGIEEGREADQEERGREGPPVDLVGDNGPPWRFLVLFVWCGIGILTALICKQAQYKSFKADEQ